jgi:DNA-binding transcriptional regulator YiaG
MHPLLEDTTVGDCTTQNHRLPKAHFHQSQSEKAIPSAIETLGDYLLLKRFEKGLSQWQVAHTMGVTTKTVKWWERDRQTLTEAQWLKLKDLLGLTDWQRKS